MKLNILIAVFLFSAATISGQEKTVTAEPIFLSVEKPEVKKLPLPDYPIDAQKAGLGGRVSVAVTVDESGNVISADDTTGPYPVCNSVTEPKVLALRAAAVMAAKKATFEPVVREHGAVKVTGRIAYVFDPKSEDISKDEKPDRMTILGTIKDNSDTGARVMRDGEVPEKQSSDGGPLPRTVSGGVLNGKALALPKPTYPPAAKAVRAGGQVAVRVLILEDGNMYSAEAITGHPLLQRVSEIAACGSKFPATLLSGNPVKVLGVITYNFVP